MSGEHRLVARCEMLVPLLEELMGHAACVELGVTELVHDDACDHLGLFAQAVDVEDEHIYAGHEAGDHRHARHDERG
jgi:hypothetical protein